MPESGGLFVIDAEENDLLEWTGSRQQGGNIIVASTDRILHGSYSFKYTYAGIDKDLAAWKNFDAETDFYCRFYFNVDVVDWAENNFINLFLIKDVDQNGATVCYLRLYREESGNMGYRFYVLDNTALNQVIAKQGQDIFSPDTTYRIEVHWKQGDGDGEWELWIDGASEGSDNAQTNTDHDIHSVVIGNATGVIPGNTAIMYFDDIKADTSYIGAYSVGDNLFATISDTLGITDDINTKIGNARSIDDGIGITDVIAKIGTYIRTLADNLASTDTINTSIGLKKSIDDGIGISDTVNASIFKLASLADNLGITDVITRTGTFIRSIPDSLGITDTITAIKSFVRSIDDSLGITDILTSEKFILAALADNLGITDTVSIIGTYVRSIADGIGITDVISKIGSYKRSITDNEAITDNITTSKGVFRNIANTVGITDVLSAIIGKMAAIADNLGITDAITFIKVTIVSGRIFISAIAKSLRISSKAKSLRVSGEEKSLRIKGSSED